MPFCPFLFGVPFLKPKSRKKGTLIIKALLRNLDKQSFCDGSNGVHKDSCGFAGLEFRVFSGLNGKASLESAFVMVYGSGYSILMGGAPRGVDNLLIPSSL